MILKLNSKVELMSLGEMLAKAVFIKSTRCSNGKGDSVLSA